MDEKAGNPAKKEGLKFRFPPLSFLYPFALVAAVLLSNPWLRGTSVGSEHPVSGEFTSPRQVARVIDGDTIELSSGTHVRYIGIDTPETRRRIGGRWIRVDEPYAREATEFNRRLVGKKNVRLEYDLERFDRYGRSLAYVYVENETGGERVFANEALVRAGLARVRIYPPNTRHSAALFEGQRRARADHLGLWEHGGE